MEEFEGMKRWVGRERVVEGLKRNTEVKRPTTFFGEQTKEEQPRGEKEG